MKPYHLTTPTHITVCTRPFRAAGPRIAAERLNNQLIIHNYGHGGSGWSLSWGSAAAALSLIQQAGNTGPIAVIGAGALGLTSAVAAQRAGHAVTIYAKDLPHETRSARATGSWTPDSRVALTSAMPATFAAEWEALARHSWQTFAPYLNAPGHPLEFQPRFTLCGPLDPATFNQRLHAEDPIGFAWLNPRLADLYQPPIDLQPLGAPFMNSPTVHEWAPAPSSPAPKPLGAPFMSSPTVHERELPAGIPLNQHIRREHQLIFNITEYTAQLLAEFHVRGGRILRREFHTPADLATLPERTLIHATGYGARQLFADDSLTPVRGQITWLPAQPEAPYSVFRGSAHAHLNLVSRRDGLVVQWSAAGESTGWQSPDETPSENESLAALTELTTLLTPSS